MRGLVVAAAAALLAVAGCRGGEETKTSPEATATAADASACQLLTAGEREALAGAPVDDVGPIEASSALPAGTQCRWTAGRLLVQVAAQPATDWAQTVPAIFDQLEAPGAGTSKDDLAEITRSRALLKDLDDITEAQSCELFSSLAQIGGFPDDSDTTVSYLPVTDSVLGVSAQTCRDGYFVSIISAGPDLKRSDAINEAAETAVAAAHARAVAQG